MTAPRAMVLAAGYGLRLRPITEKTPKPLVPVAGRTMLDRALDSLVASGIGHAVVNVHHLGEQIEARLSERARSGLAPTTEISVEPVLLDTGGGIKNALARLGAAPFLAVNADIVWEDGPVPALKRLTAAYDPATMDALLLLVHRDRAVGFDGPGDFYLEFDGRLVRRSERPSAPYVYAGLQMLTPSLFEGSPDGAFSLNRLYDKALARNRLFGLVHDSAWYHVGTPEALKEADRILSQPREWRDGAAAERSGGLQYSGRTVVCRSSRRRAVGTPWRRGSVVRSDRARQRHHPGTDPGVLCVPSADALARRFEGSVVLLPRILALGELDLDDNSDIEDAPDDFAATEIPPAITPLRRQMLLSNLVSRLGTSAWKEKPTADQAARLAAELALLLDQIETEELSFGGLEALVPATYAEHWQKTLAFLRILTLHWPAILAEEKAIDPAARRIRLLRARVESWQKKPPNAPVIAAGSTGSIPAVGDLLATVARLPQGAVILPGLDPALSNAGWMALEPGHPQFGLRKLIEKIGIARGEIRLWPGAEPDEKNIVRTRLIGAALAPSEVAEIEGIGALTPKLVEAACDGLRRIDCPSPDDEAGVIALLMRHTLDMPGKTCALITPDRNLARRVSAALKRWNVDVDDSAGTPLALTPAGLYFRLIAEAASERFAPLSLLSLFKHPFASGGEATAQFRARVRQIELLALHGPRPAPGLQGLAERLGELSPDRAPDARELARWVAALAETAKPLVEALSHGSHPVIEIVRAHVAFAEALAATDSENGAERLWRGDDGEALANFVAELEEAARGFAPVASRDYASLLAALLTGRVVRPRAGRHPRLQIWGPLEARLQGADRLILAGLNEGTWPREPEADPWMSRPMRKDFGLPAPERRIGLAAHDFVQAACAPEVFITRSVRVEGTPTVPARWLLRLDHFLTRANVPGALGAKQPWLQWQAALDRVDQEAPKPKRPEPRPPVETRPRKLNVTDIETWMRDPYALYARRILDLRSLDPIDAQKDAADRGNFIHKALDAFLKVYPDSLPDQETAYQRLLELGRQAFGSALEQAGVRAFWWPRFERIARWFVAEEAKRRATARPLKTEAHGSLTIETNGKPFMLIGRADRIDRRLDDGTLVLSDYKTGAPPSASQIAEGFSPQLPLEAAMAARGAFEGIPATPASELLHWRLSGGDPPGEIKTAVTRDEDAASLAEKAFAGLAQLIATFDDPNTPYLATPRADRALKFSDYDHLARTQEWASGDGDGEGGE